MDEPRKKILFLTGTRADFGKLKPLIAQVEAAPEFDAHVFATGMHLLARYGYTVEEIRDCGFAKIYPYMNQAGSGAGQMDLALASSITGLSHYVREHNPDLIVAHGDRVEALAGAIVGALNNTLVAHVEGGEVSGTVDELLRHAVSKLSHLHFVANDEARSRLIQMGEAASSIYVIGSPDVDVMLSDRLPPLDDVRRWYEIPFDEYAIFAYHPVTTEERLLKFHVEETVAALKESGWNFVVIYPNNDLGSEIIMDAILPLERVKGFRALPSMRFEYFLTLLKNARAIVGNSSAGIREAPVYGVPALNLGTRQRNRFHHPSIVNAPEDRRAILEALRRLPRRFSPSLHFGQGRSAELFMAALRSPALWSIARQKQFVDLPVRGLAAETDLLGA